jgi:N-methylhydantoinase B
MKPIEIRTRPGTIAHCTYPAPVGLCTLYVAQQIIESVWDSLAKVVPEKTPAGWGGFAAFALSGIDPRRGEGYATPDFLSVTSGAGAIWGTDGWHGNHSPISSGGLSYPEIEICESMYPAMWTKWEFITDSGGAGKWFGGTGIESTFTLEADEMSLCHQGDHFITTSGPVVAGGKRPPYYCRRILTRADGSEEEGGGAFYTLHRGEQLACYSQGGCGVGDPLDRKVEQVKDDILNEITSPENARELYGVVLKPETLALDEAATEKLRSKKRQDTG